MLVRKLFAGFAFCAFVLTSGQVFAYCSHDNGTWADDEGGTYYLSNNSGQALVPCGYGYYWWNVAGSFSNGSFTLNVTNPNPGSDPNCNNGYTYGGNVDGAGCAHVTYGFWQSAYGQNYMTMDKPTCDVPQHETTSTSGAGGWSGTVYNFDVNIDNGADGNLGGRYYKEANWSQAQDLCWLTGDNPDWQVRGVGNGTDVLGTDNHYYDSVGLPSAAVSTYQSTGRNCKTDVYQEMQLACGVEANPLPWVREVDNTIEIQVTPISYTVIRAGVPQSK